MDPNGSVLETSVRPVWRARAAISVPTLLLVLAAAGPATGQDWFEDAKLRARDAVTDDTFGWSVSVDDGRALIGVHPNRNPGAAYVFERVGNSWREVATLTPTNPASEPNNHFGTSMALDGDRALVGAFLDTRDGGSAYIFELTGDDWVQVAHLTAGNPAAGDAFGWSVALDGDRALVAAVADEHSGERFAGSVYVFELVGDSWIEVDNLVASDAGRKVSLFGWSVALDGDRALASAAADNHTGNDSGAVYVFEPVGDSWMEVAKLIAHDAAQFDQFGFHVALDGDRALIGANFDDHARGQDAGSAYIFEIVDGDWVEVAKLTASDATPGDDFGISVALEGDRLLVGAPFHDEQGADDAGSAYMFELLGGKWIEVAKLTASDASTNDYFGWPVALDGDSIVVAAWYNDVIGSVYIFSGPSRAKGPLSLDFVRGEMASLTRAAVPIGPVVDLQRASPVVATSQDNLAAGAIGDTAVWDLSATDCTFKAQKNEVWIVDSHSDGDPFILTFRADNLVPVAPESIRIVLPAELADAKVLGLADIPEGNLQGLNFVLVDTTFGTTDPPDPRIALYRNVGTLLARAAFGPVLGLDPTARLSSIAVNPDAAVEEIAAYDLENHAFYILDFSFRVVRGPTPCLGSGHFFAGPWRLGKAGRGSGMGITYNGPDTVLVTEGFFNSVETRFALEYDARGGSGYTGRALDLGAASAEGAIDVAFAAATMGVIDGQEALFALNVSDERLYAFSPIYQDQPQPVRPDLNCTWDSVTGQYTVSWDLDAAALVDYVLVFENGVQVATLPPATTEFQSALPMVGKVFIEIATARGNVVSDIRQVCELDNTQTPRLPDVPSSANAPGNAFVYGDLAVTKTPQSPDDFRMFVYLDSSTVAVFNHRPEVIDVYRLTMPVTETVLPRQGIGLTLAPLDETTHLAALDPNGFDNSGFPSVAFFPLEGDRGVATRVVESVDFRSLPETLALRNWDYFDNGGEGYYVAAGSLDDSRTQYVLVRLEFANHVFRATHMVPVPQRILNPFKGRPRAGIAVSVLPSGNLMVAGGNPLLRSYTEAVLATRFDGDVATAATFVGYAQGLPVPGQLLGFGPDVGPRKIDGLATAYFPPQDDASEGIGVTYNDAELPILVTNPSGQSLVSGHKLVIHSENDVSHPDLLAEQLFMSDILFQAGETRSSGAVTASFAADIERIDYYVTLINLAGFVSVPASLEVLLDGATIPELSRDLVLGPGRNLRVRIPQRTEKNCQVRITNGFDDALEIRVIIGAIAPGYVSPGDDPLPGEDDTFRRGDCNADGAVQLADAIFGLSALFQGKDQPSCLDACDLDDDGTVNLGDMIAILGFLFRAQGDPLPPGPNVCGPDPVLDDLATCVYDACQ